MVVLGCDENVRRLQIAVNDPFLVRVLNALAELNEEAESFGDGEPMPVTVCGQTIAAHVLHCEVRPPEVRGPRFEHLGDCRMVHQCERLALRFEARDYLRCVETCFDDFDGDLPADWMHLFRQPDITHTAFAQSFEQAIRADIAAGDSGCNASSRKVSRRRRWGVGQRYSWLAVMWSARTPMSSSSVGTQPLLLLRLRCSGAARHHVFDESTG